MEKMGWGRGWCASFGNKTKDRQSFYLSCNDARSLLPILDYMLFV